MSRQTLEAARNAGLSVNAALAVLDIDEHPETKAGEIAARLGISSAAITQIVAALQEKHIAATLQDPRDLRLVRVLLTSRGKLLAKELSTN